MDQQRGMSTTGKKGPHQRQRPLAGGPPLERAKAAMILVHGRGATAKNILSLADEFAQPEVAFLAPQAAGNSWYPYSFLAPLEQNEPGLSSGLGAIDDALRQIETSGIPLNRIVLLGFSQGACLVCEYAARHSVRYGGVIVWSGGLIGTGEVPGARPPFDKQFEYVGSLEGTPVFIGCSDVDPHVPLERVQESAQIMRTLGGEVTERIYDGMGHTINEEEVRFVRGLLAGLTAPEEERSS